MIINKKIIYNIKWILITLAIVSLDQITKYIVVKSMGLNDEITVIGGFFKLLYVRNPGAGLGMLANARWVFLLFTSVVIVIAIVLLSMNYFKNKFAHLSVVFILGGGIGNMIDRIVTGTVVDFFQFQIKYFDFIFNVADVFVSVGAVMFVIYYIFLNNNQDYDGKQNK